MARSRHAADSHQFAAAERAHDDAATMETDENWSEKSRERVRPTPGILDAEGPSVERVVAHASPQELGGVSKIDALQFAERQRVQGGHSKLIQSCVAASSHATARWSQRPRRERNARKDERCDHFLRTVAVGGKRCRRTGQFEEDASIRPLLEPRPTWRKQDDRTRNLPQSEDGENVRRIAEVRDDVSDKGS